MKYLLSICSDGIPGPEQMAVMRREIPGWAEEMDRRGIRLFGRELELPETAVTVRVGDGETLVSDGPFAETKEFMAGFDLLECADLDEAIEVASKHATSWFHMIEVRPFRSEPQLGEAASQFARGEDSAGTPYLLALWSSETAAPAFDDQTVADEVEAWRRDLDTRGAYVVGNALEGPDTATTVSVRDGKTLLDDGPFTQTEDFIAGIEVVNCANRELAIELAAAHPLAPHHAIEVRPFYSE